MEDSDSNMNHYKEQSKDEGKLMDMESIEEKENNIKLKGKKRIPTINEKIKIANEAI